MEVLVDLVDAWRGEPPTKEEDGIIRAGRGSGGRGGGKGEGRGRAERTRERKRRPFAGRRRRLQECQKRGGGPSGPPDAEARISLVELLVPESLAPAALALVAGVLVVRAAAHPGRGPGPLGNFTRGRSPKRRKLLPRKLLPRGWKVGSRLEVSCRLRQHDHGPAHHVDPQGSLGLIRIRLSGRKSSIKS